jgi:Tol biopolymer transport system component
MPLPLTTAAGAGNLAIANDGTLVYVDLPGGVAANARTLVWVDRTGKEEAIDAPPRAYLQPRLSPDGKRIAVWTNDQTNDISIWDLERKMLTPLTRDPGEDQHPLWTRDGKGIIFSSNRSGVFNLWRQAADGTGEPEQLTKSSGPQFATGITPDGTAVVFFETKSAPVRDLNVLQLALDETHRVTPLLMQEKVHETEATVSPNGQWLAYESTLTGSKEIYVRLFRTSTAHSRVSRRRAARDPSGRPAARNSSMLQSTGPCCRCPWRRRARL